MILGIGTDIVDVSRIEEASLNNSFLEKVFSLDEIEYLKSRNMRPEYIAGRFAAKEAVAKSLGTGFREFNLKDIIIDRTILGKPLVVLKGKAKQIAEKNSKYNLQVSISHEKGYAIAYAILEVENSENWDVRDDEKY